MLRFQTYFGVPIPPFKEEKLGAGSTTIRFVITGTIPSKKNCERSVSVRRDAKKLLFDTQKTEGFVNLDDALKAVYAVYSKITPNFKYLTFVEAQKPVIQAQAAEWSERLGKKGLIFPLPKAAMSLRLYFKDRYVTDTVNKQQTIQDLLIACGVIANDDYKSLNPISSASACYYQELIHDIAFVSLSFQLPK
jgi:hypothetical protein